MKRGWLARTPQMERPRHLRYGRIGIHDHHYNAARTDEEREIAHLRPGECYDDERCYWDGGESGR